MVRTIAIPVLVTGSYGVSPLPPQLDIAVGHEDLRAELETAGRAPAVVRVRDRIAAVVARAGLVDVLAPSEALSHKERGSEPSRTDGGEA
ncbi:hypothetical protein ACWGH4_18920 [Streptomyces sp. NPDC054847]